MLTYSPADIAIKFGCKVDKVLAWIANGELRAINVATNRHGGKPRWRITPEALDDFERSRSTNPKPAPPTRQRRKLALVGKEYF